MKREYVREISVENNGHIEHDECIDHCLPYAFGECNKMHSIRCSQCSKLYSFFNELKSISWHDVRSGHDACSVETTRRKHHHW